MSIVNMLITAFVVAFFLFFFFFFIGPISGIFLVTKYLARGILSFCGWPTLIPFRALIHKHLHRRVFFFFFFSFVHGNLKPIKLNLIVKPINTLCFSLIFERFISFCFVCLFRQRKSLSNEKMIRQHGFWEVNVEYILEYQNTRISP